MKTFCLTVAATLVLSLASANRADAKPPCCGFWLVDWESWCTTAHAQFDLESMMPYYMPRTPPCCVTPRYWVDPCGCETCNAPQVSDGFEPAGFQHLGQIPNDSLLEDIRTER